MKKIILSLSLLSVLIPLEAHPAISRQTHDTSITYHTCISPYPSKVGIKEIRTTRPLSHLTSLPSKTDVKLLYLDSVDAINLGIEQWDATIVERGLEKLDQSQLSSHTLYIILKKSVHFAKQINNSYLIHIILDSLGNFNLSPQKINGIKKQIAYFAIDFLNKELLLDAIENLPDNEEGAVLDFAVRRTFYSSKRLFLDIFERLELLYSPMQMENLIYDLYEQSQTTSTLTFLLNKLKKYNPAQIPHLAQRSYEKSIKTENIQLLQFSLSVLEEYNYQIDITPSLIEINSRLHTNKRTKKRWLRMGLLASVGVTLPWLVKGEHARTISIISGLCSLFTFGRTLFITQHKSKDILELLLSSPICHIADEELGRSLLDKITLCFNKKE